MKRLLFFLAFLAAQPQISWAEDVVRLPPHLSAIPAADGGKMVELLYAAAAIFLPGEPPKDLIQGAPWYVDVKNLGPAEVALQAKNGFVVHLRPNETVRIRSTGDTYSAGRP